MRGNAIWHFQIPDLDFRRLCVTPRGCVCGCHTGTISASAFRQHMAGCAVGQRLQYLDAKNTLRTGHNATRATHATHAALTVTAAASRSARH